jgi:FtsZ-binding cell division protein ZapB
MVIINKILNVLVFLLAITACIAAVLLHERRVEMRERANVMAGILDKVATIVDGNGETSSELNVHAKVNEKELGWEKFHHALDENGQYPTWINQAATIEKSTESLFAMKIDLADALLKVSENLEYEKPEGLRSSLNSVNTFSTFTEKIYQQSARIRQRDDRLAQALVQVSKTIKKDIDVGSFKGLAAENKENEGLEKNIDVLLSHTGHLYGRANLLANGLSDLNKAFPADLDGEVLFSPKWSALDFQSESVEDLNKAFALLQNDLKTLNDKLYKLKVANGMIAGQRVKLARQSDTIEVLNMENDELKNTNGSLRASIKGLKKFIAANQKPKGISHKQVTAEVVEVNDRFNFIVINRGSEDGLVLQASMIVHEKGRFVCRVKATKVFENSAVCEILGGHLSVEASDKELIPSLGASAITVND